MPLNCDCYGGCWGTHSENWPAIRSSKEEIDRLFRMAGREQVLPYGTYVRNSDIELRIETYALMECLVNSSKKLKLEHINR